MDDLAGSENLYIRSFGSRSASDGLTDNLPELLETMDRFGFDEVILETVGVGQAEFAARTHVDTLILVIPPDAGDVVQAMKAGIIEIADIFAINKADMPSAAKMATEIKRIVALTHRGRAGWMPPVVLTSASKPESIAQLSQHVDRHLESLRMSGEFGSRASSDANIACGGGSKDPSRRSSTASPLRFSTGPRRADCGAARAAWSHSTALMREPRDEASHSFRHEEALP